MEEKLDMLWYTLADVYGDDIATDTPADELDEDEITELILEDLERRYDERPEYIEVYINDGIGVDTEIEVRVDWAE